MNAIRRVGNRESKMTVRDFVTIRRRNDIKIRSGATGIGPGEAVIVSIVSFHYKSVFRLLLPRLAVGTLSLQKIYQPVSESHN